MRKSHLRLVATGPDATGEGPDRSPAPAASVTQPVHNASLEDALLDSFELLDAPCPPMLVAALGYIGTHRFVAVLCSIGASGLEITDGMTAAEADAEAWQAFSQHPRMLCELEDYTLADGAVHPAYCIVIDREELNLYVGSRDDARRMLAYQSSAGEVAPVAVANGFAPHAPAAGAPSSGGRPALRLVGPGERPVRPAPAPVASSVAAAPADCGQLRGWLEDPTAGLQI